MVGVVGLPYFIQAEGQLQQQALQRQQAQIQLAAFQQQQQDRQRAQAAQAAAGNALPQLFAGGQPAAIPAPPAPQAPPPGQASQPAPQPRAGGVPSLPPAGRPPLPPFRPMPTTPPQAAAPQGAIPAPPAQAAASPAPQPQSGPLTFESAIKVLRDQGLEGADLFAGLQQLQPILDAQAKAQAAAAQQQFTRELQMAQLQERYDSLKQRAADAQANREDRAAAREEARATRLQIAEMSNATRRAALDFKIQGNPDSALSKDDLKFMAQQYIAAPDPSIFTNLGRGAQGAKNLTSLRQAIMEEAKAQNLSPQELAAKGIAVAGEKAGARAAGTKTANIEIAANEAKQTFPLVRQYSDALPRTQSLDINAVLNAGQTRTGDPRWVQLGQAMDTAINAYARAISPTGTPTVESRQQARAHFTPNMTPQQINGVLDVMEREMGAALRAPGEVQKAQRARISGKTEGAAPAAGLPQGWSVQEH